MIMGDLQQASAFSTCAGRDPAAPMKKAASRTRGVHGSVREARLARTAILVLGLKPEVMRFLLPFRVRTTASWTSMPERSRTKDLTVSWLLSAGKFRVSIA